MEIVRTLATTGFDQLTDAEKMSAFKEFEEKKNNLKKNTDMITVLEGTAWVMVNEYTPGELTATFLLPREY